jgi:hypothetical protein
MSTETIEVSEIVLEVTEPAVEPVVEPVVPEPAPAPTSQGLFDSIDWKNPVPSVIKLATHLHSLNTLSPQERLTMMQGSLLFVIQQSPMPDSEKETAKHFVQTMLPHVVETALVTLQATAKVMEAEKKVEEVMTHFMSTQPKIMVKNIESVIAEASKVRWWCGW